MWKEVVEKAIDAKAKANLQLPSLTRKIDSRYLKDYKLSVKKDKEYNRNWKHWNRDKDKIKSHILLSTNTQPQV